DPHFAVRGTFATIRHPELNRDLRYPGTVATNGDAPHMSYTRRAPRIGEHTDAIMRWAGFGDEDIQAFRARRLVK
ncbi:MAG TPA: hypothetical protein VJ718_02270, partial [Candidatus Binataceae bacterium]|nr:hypothetical protein [Candidatus Binataceae bacterium]